MKFLILIGSLMAFSSLIRANGLEREINEAPKEPPYISEEEWEQMQESEGLQVAPAAPQKTAPEKYQILEETKDYYRVRHPLESKGLQRITADGEYIYKTTPSEISHYVGISAGVRKMPKLINAQTDKDFETIYKNSVSIFVDTETPFSRKIGNLNWLYGVGISFAGGNGYLGNDKTEAIEKYSLFMIPAYIGLSYHFQYSDNQWFVPFVSVGADLVGIIETRNDGKTLRSYTYGGHGGGGVRFRIDSLMADNNDLDQDFGINHVWLSLEARAIVGADKNLDISSNSVSLGLGLEL